MFTNVTHVSMNKQLYQQKKWADKPGSVEDDHLSCTYVATRLIARNPNARKGSRIAFLFALAPDGVYQAAALLQRWCALTTPFQLFPHTHRREFSFLWHFPSGYPAQPLAGILPLGARTFLTLSKNARSSGPLTASIVYRAQTITKVAIAETTAKAHRTIQLVHL